MAKSALTASEKAAVADQARSDVSEGKYTEYKGDAVADVVFAPLDALSGWKSTSGHAADKQDFYDDVRDGMKDDSK